MKITYKHAKPLPIAAPLQRRFARICMRRSNREEEGKRAGKKERSAAHAAAFNMLLPFFFFSSARANLSQRAIPARFSGM